MHKQYLVPDLAPILDLDAGTRGRVRSSLADLLRSQLADPATSWAIGTFGAIAEFHRDSTEPTALSERRAVTARGGIHLQATNEVRAIAWERPSSGDGWTQGISLCLTTADSAMNGRTAITELGPDGEALHKDHRAEVLFDLGIAAPHCDVCVRTADPALLRVLRAATGRSVLTTGLLGELAATSPTRVFLSRLGRVEVRTAIPKPDGKTPDGPHTHVLPELLKLKRTHSANVPLPNGYVPCAELFPASAIHDAHGRRKAFEAGKHEAFQALLAVYGDPACVAAKRETAQAVRAAQPPLDVPWYTRAQRHARRVALRQLAHTDAASAALDAWRATFDRDT